MSEEASEGEVYSTAPSSGPRLEIDVPFEASLDVYDIAFSPDGRTLATAFGSTDGVIGLWDTRTGRLRRSLPVRYSGRSRSGTTSLAYSPDGKTLAYNVAAQTGKTRRYAIQLWNPRTGKLVRTLADSGDALSPVCYSRDGSLLAVDRMHKFPVSMFQMWDVRTARPLWSVSPYESTALFAGGHQVAVSTAHPTGAWETRLVDAKTGQPIRRLPGEAGSARVAAISADERYILGTLREKRGSHFDEEAALWDVATGRRILSIGSITNNQTALALSMDGETIAYARSGSGYVTLRNLPTGAAKTLDGQQNRANTIVFSPDGTRVAAASKDGAVRLWERKSGRLLVTMLMVQSAPKGPTLGDWIAFNPSGHFAATNRAEAYMRWRAEGITVPISSHEKEFRSPSLITVPLDG
jgi:WD40 repeat protein